MRRAVNAIVLVLILIMAGGLLAVGIVNVRQTATRMRCTNNFRSIGIALSSYHEAMEHFPQAGFPNPALPPEKRLSWHFILLAYYEATPWYGRVDRAKGWDAEENRFLALMYFGPVDCPGVKDQPLASTYFPTPYIGITGLGPAAAALPLNDRNAGLFGYDRKVSLSDLKRGQSEVLVVLETAQVSGAWTAAGPPTARGLEGEGPFLGAGAHFGGCHPGGANALFADGSVRFLANAVDPDVIWAMARIADGDEVQEVGSERGAMLEENTCTGSEAKVRGRTQP